MCGIAGVMSFDEKPVSLEELHAMCGAMLHRGADDEGIYLEKDVGLAMRRLSIIDLETGHQPVSNEDGTIWVVLNGEIYNFRQLRRELEHRGHTFSTATDTEVIVHLYEEHGPRCVEHLRLSGFDAEGCVGDADPGQAIEDALALFEADVLVVDGNLADHARRRVGLPIVPVRAAA